MSIRLYACGGTGLNIGKDFYKLETIPGFADIKTCFIDTSLSNIRSKDGKVIELNRFKSFFQDRCWNFSFYFHQTIHYCVHYAFPIFLLLFYSYVVIPQNIYKYT